MPIETVFREDLFEGQVAIVTGGATGIGLAIAEELVRLGAGVVIASRKLHRLLTAARGLSRDHDGRVEAIACNIREREEVDALFDQTLSRFGRVDLVVNNGGGQFLAPAEEIRDKGWRAVIDTNLNGTFYMCQAAGAKWMFAHGGRIVNIVADMWNGFPGMAHTGAARAGVENLTKTLAVEWAKYGIKINCVAPGIILSSGAHNYPPGTLQALAKTIPLKRLGRCEEVAAATLFLLSPAADYITGTTSRVDGGSSSYSGRWPIPDPKDPAELEIPPWPEERWPELAVDADAPDASGAED